MSERDRRYRGNNSSRNNSSRNNSSRNNSSRNNSSRNNNRSGGGNNYNRRPRQFYLSKGSNVYVLDILQHGGVDKPNHSWAPICQAMEVPSFQLFDIVLNKGHTVQLQQKIIISGENGPLGKVQRRLNYDKLTPTSKDMIKAVLGLYISEDEERFVKFINNSAPITIKRHSLEVLPGVGKKLMWEIVNARNIKSFENFADLNERVPGFKTVEVFKKRIIEELNDPDQKHFLFVKRPKKRPTNERQSPRPQQNRRRY
jgi:putative nucleotide binding protein